MKVDVTREPRGFHYKLTLDEDDHKESWRSLKDVKAKKLQLVGDEYRVELPEVFTHVHPDLHATAIAFALWPFLGSRLTLPFGVSSLYARLMEARHGVRVTNVDPVLTPRRAPEGWRPCLLFSGGADSVAASMVMPPDTVTLFYDRIVHRELAPSWERNLADQAPNRAVCDDIRALGRELHIVRDDHEALWRPYPGWHDEMSVMPVLYLADSLKLAVYESGNTLSVFAFGGYHVEDEPQWAFQKWDGAANPEEALSVPVVEDEVETLAPDDRPATIRFSGVLEAMGLTPGSCLAGLTEVATTILVARSPMRNKAFSCYYQPDPEAEGRYCLRCDKCFNKLLMLYIVEDREVPAELFESFLRHRHLAEILARPIYDWHHLWYYTFQKLRCSHPVAQRLHESALQGPDLSVLEKWYIPVRRALPGRYLAHVSAAIEEHVEPMSESDIQVLESMHVPPLVVPEELRPYL